MKRDICRSSYFLGIAHRNLRPLHRGRYKLEEFQRDLTSFVEEVAYIRRFVCGHADQWGLRHCTSSDKGAWLKDLPSSVAYLIGYELKPGVGALSGDGVDPTTVLRLTSKVDRHVEEVLARLEGVRNSISKRIGVEYSHMRSGGSLIEPPLQETLHLVQSILTGLASSPDDSEITERLPSTP